MSCSFGEGIQPQPSSLARLVDTTWYLVVHTTCSIIRLSGINIKLPRYLRDWIQRITAWCEQSASNRYRDSGLGPGYGVRTVWNTARSGIPVEAHFETSSAPQRQAALLPGYLLTYHGPSVLR